MADDMKNPDVEHLRLLGIFEYVLAALSVLIGCCPMIYLGFGVAIVAGAFDNDPNPPPAELGLWITVGAGCLTVYMWVYAALEVLTAHSLHRHRWYRFCFVMACIELLNLPLGTIQGVFMLLVLCRPSVHALFLGMGYRDPRLEALDEFEDDERDDAAPPKSEPGDDTVREGAPPRA